MKDDFLKGIPDSVNKNLNNLVDRADVEKSFDKYKNVLKYLSAEDDKSGIEEMMDNMKKTIVNDLFNK